MPKHKPFAYLRPVEVESIERLRGARKVAPAGLPSMRELLAAHGHDWICDPRNANVRFVSPFPCLSCGNFVHRCGDGSCVACFLPLPDIVVEAKAKKEAKSKTDSDATDNATP